MTIPLQKAMDLPWACCGKSFGKLTSPLLPPLHHHSLSTPPPARGSACSNPVHCLCPEENEQAVPATPQVWRRQGRRWLNLPLTCHVLSLLCCLLFAWLLWWKLFVGASLRDFLFQAHILGWLVQAGPCMVRFSSFEAPNSPHVLCKPPSRHSESWIFERSVLWHIEEPFGLDILVLKL